MTTKACHDIPQMLCYMMPAHARGQRHITDAAEMRPPPRIAQPRKNTAGLPAPSRRQHAISTAKRRRHHNIIFQQPVTERAEKRAPSRREREHAMSAYAAPAPGHSSSSPRLMTGCRRPAPPPFPTPMHATTRFHFEIITALC